MFKNKALIPIFIVVFVDLLGFSIILPFLPYYAMQFHASDFMIGILIASYSVCQFIASPILGGLSDRFGRRPLLIYSQAGSIIGFILLAFAQSLPMLFLSRIIDGISGGNLTIAQAYITDVTEPKDRSAALGVIGVAFGLGFMIGPLLGGELAKNFGYMTVGLVAAAFSTISTSLTIFYLKEPGQHKRDENAKTGIAYYKRVFDYFKFPYLPKLLTIFLLFAFPFSLYVSMFSLFANKEFGFNESQVGRFLFMIGFLGVVWQAAVIRPLVKRYGDVQALRFAFIALSIGLFGIAFAANWQQLVIVAVVFSFGTSITRPTLSSIISQAVPPTRRGGALGVTASIESASRSLAPVLGGWIIGALHPNYLGYVGGVLAMVGMILAFTLHAKAFHHEEGAK